MPVFPNDATFIKTNMKRELINEKNVDTRGKLIDGKLMNCLQGPNHYLLKFLFAGHLSRGRGPEAQGPLKFQNVALCLPEKFHSEYYLLLFCILISQEIKTLCIGALNLRYSTKTDVGITLLLCLEIIDEDYLHLV